MAAEIHAICAGRTGQAPARFRLLGDGQCESVRTRAPGEDSCRLGPDAGAIEPGLEGQEQFRFVPQGRAFVNQAGETRCGEGRDR